MERIEKTSARREHGVVFVEFALVLPIFFLFLLAIADITRYFTTKIILNHAAMVGLGSAVTRPELEFDPYIDSSKNELLRDTAREFVVEETLKYPRAVLPWVADLGAGLSFAKYRHVAGPNDDAQSAATLDGLVLLPGESVALIKTEKIVAEEKGGEEKYIESIKGWLDYPYLCSKVSPSCATPRKSPKQDSRHHVLQLLRSLPIIVEVRVELHFMTPGFSPRVVVGRAAGYRERMPSLVSLGEGQGDV